MNIIAITAHEVMNLDNRHLGLLTPIVLVWIASWVVGSWVARRDPIVLYAAFASMLLLVFAAYFADHWLGLAAIQVPLLFFVGYKAAGGRL